MIDEFDTYTSQLANMYKEKMDELISRKLQMLERKALMSNELELARILSELDLRDIEKTRNELAQNGYSIELEYPQPNLEFKEHMAKAIINAEEIKLRVRKLIFEI